MADVFLLGAGCSKAISPAMPVVAELIEPLADHLDDQVAARYGTTLRNIRDLEAVLTGWAEPQPWLLEEEVLENQAAFKRATRWLAGELFQRQQHALGSGTSPDWLTGLAGRWHEDRAGVITLNYDTLVESTVQSMTHGSGPALHQSLYGSFLPPIASLSGFGVFGGPLVETFRLLKLHGSLNWWYNPSQGTPRPYRVDCVDQWNGSERVRLDEVVQEATGLDPLIVPPVTSKALLLGNPWLRRMWVDAGGYLQAAERIFLLGYSMPPADIPMRLLLATAPVRQLVPVCTDQWIVDRLIGLFPEHEIIDRWISDDPIPTFTDAYLEGKAR